MLTKEERDRLVQVVGGLRRDDTPWSALGPLAEMSTGGTDVSIDFTAEQELGGPVIVASRRTALPAGLTPRQRAVCEALARGLSNKEIARDLGISPATVKDHVHAILRELGLRSRSEVAAHLHGIAD